MQLVEQSEGGQLRGLGLVQVAVGVEPHVVVVAQTARRLAGQPVQLAERRRREQVAAHRGVVGDVLHVRPGEAFVADALVLEPADLREQVIALLRAVAASADDDLLADRSAFEDFDVEAAGALRAMNAEAAVIEDSPTGVIAGAAAGSHVLGFCPDSPVHQSAETLLAAGAAETFSAMDQLPGLLTE